MAFEQRPERWKGRRLQTSGRTFWAAGTASTKALRHQSVWGLLEYSVGEHAWVVKQKAEAAAAGADVSHSKRSQWRTSPDDPEPSLKQPSKHIAQSSTVYWKKGKSGTQSRISPWWLWTFPNSKACLFWTSPIPTLNESTQRPGYDVVGLLYCLPNATR